MIAENTNPDPKIGAIANFEAENLKANFEVRTQRIWNEHRRQT